MDKPDFFVSKLTIKTISPLEQFSVDDIDNS